MPLSGPYSFLERIDLSPLARNSHISFIVESPHLSTSGPLTTYSLERVSARSLEFLSIQSFLTLLSYARTNVCMKKQSLITYCASSHQPCEVWIIVLFSMQESEDFRAETGIQSQVFIWAFTFSRGWIRVYISYNIESCKCSGTHSSPLSSVSPQPGGTPLKI